MTDDDNKIELWGDLDELLGDAHFYMPNEMPLQSGILHMEGWRIDAMSEYEDEYIINAEFPNSRTFEGGSMNDLIVFYDEKQARYMERMIRRLWYGDALTRSEGLIQTSWRLEYISPTEGEPHYRLYHQGETIGIQYVRAASWLPQVQRKLAAYLVIVGFLPDNTTLVVGGAKTPERWEHNRLPKLFATRFDKRWRNRARGQSRQRIRIQSAQMRKPELLR